MYRRLTLFLLGATLILFTCVAEARSDSLKTSNPVAAKNVVYLEGGGSAYYGSVNLERQLARSGFFAATARLGLGTYPIRDFNNEVNPDLYLPFGFQFLFGKTHRFETGIGALYSSTIQYDFNQMEMIRNRGLHSNFSAGYRYKSDDGGLFLRVLYVSILPNNRGVVRWAGLSIGSSF